MRSALDLDETRPDGTDVQPTSPPQRTLQAHKARVTAASRLANHDWISERSDERIRRRRVVGSRPPERRTRKTARIAGPNFTQTRDPCSPRPHSALTSPSFHIHARSKICAIVDLSYCCLPGRPHCSPVSGPLRDSPATPSSLDHSSSPASRGRRVALVRADHFLIATLYAARLLAPRRLRAVSSHAGGRPGTPDSAHDDRSDVWLRKNPAISARSA